jgi:outer membrane protein TolC
MKHLIFVLLITTTLKARAQTPFTLDMFLKDVAEQNLSLHANAAAAEALTAKSVGLNLPPPMAAITQMEDQSGTANGFEVSQEIPFPTKLTSDQKARNFEAHAGRAELTVTKNEVLAQARFLFVSLWLTQERIKSLNSKKVAIQQHLKLSTASARSDSFLRIHVLKAESDLDLLDNEILEIEQVIREKQIQMAEYAGKNSVDFKPTLSEPPIAAIPEKNELSESPQIEMKRFALQALQARESESKSEWLPDFNLRYREMGGTTMTPKFSEVMVGITLPFVYFWEPHATSKSATAEKIKAEAELSQAKLSVGSRKAILTVRAESLKKQLEQINQKLLPRAEKRMRLVHNLAPRDMESLQDHREAMEAFPDLQLKALDLREKFEQTAAELSSFASGAP